MKSEGVQFSNGGDAKRFALAGCAYITVVSKASGARFTYRIVKKASKNDEKASVFFVSVLSGPDNGADYRFFGTIFEDESFRHSSKHGITTLAPSAVAWAWTWERLRKGETHPQLEVWHEGRCGRCGRKLTVPDSIASGLGPECASKS